MSVKKKPVNGKKITRATDLSRDRTDQWIGKNKESREDRRWEQRTRRFGRFGQ